MKSIFRTWTALALAAAFLASSMMTSAATSGTTTTKKAATTKTTKAVKKPAAQTASKAAPRAGIARNPYIGAIVMDAVTGQEHIPVRVHEMHVRRPQHISGLVPDMRGHQQQPIRAVAPQHRQQMHSIGPDR